MAKIRVLLVDDQPLFVESLGEVLQLRNPDIKVVGIAHNGSEAIEFVRSTDPDVILMDVRMPVLDGVNATKLIHAEYPAKCIIMLTTFDDDEYVQDAIANGAVGYVLKNIPIKDLSDSIRLVHEGVFLVSSTITPKIRLKFSHAMNPISSNASPPKWFTELTRREKEILVLMASGLDNKEISAKLGLGEQTARTHVASIYSKLGVHDRSHAMRLIIDANIDLSRV